MFVGTLGAIVTGSSNAAFNIIFGEMMNTLNRDPSGFENAVNQLCIDFVIVASVSIVCGFFQVSFANIVSRVWFENLWLGLLVDR